MFSKFNLTYYKELQIKRRTFIFFVEYSNKEVEALKHQGLSLLLQHKVMEVEIVARQARMESPTDYYHVMMRGNNRENIFKDKNQKIFFIELLKGSVEDKLVDIAGYCIMDNHVHIIIKSELSNLSKFIKSINTKYAMRFNKQKDRVGHVFQGRYKSEIISDEIYLLQVIRYVHNNPVIARIVKSPDDYRWSSYREYIKVGTIISKEVKEFILDCYGSMGQFIEFHKKDDNQEYLETKEDIEQYRINRGKETISMYLKDKEINKSEVLKLEPTDIDEIIILLKQLKLSHRQIASLLDISNSRVHRNNMGD